MRCVVCKQADTQSGVTTVMLQRGEATFVVSEVPAQICANCGEDYVDANVAAALLLASEDLSRAAAQLDVRRYAAAA